MKHHRISVVGNTHHEIVKRCIKKYRLAVVAVAAFATAEEMYKKLPMVRTANEALIGALIANKEQRESATNWSTRRALQYSQCIRLPQRPSLTTAYVVYPRQRGGAREPDRGTVRNSLAPVQDFYSQRDYSYDRGAGYSWRIRAPVEWHSGIQSEYDNRDRLSYVHDRYASSSVALRDDVYAVQSQKRRYNTAPVAVGLARATTERACTN